MITNLLEQARYIYDEWNAGFDTKDLYRIMRLYAEDAVIPTAVADAWSFPRIKRWESTSST